MKNAFGRQKNTEASVAPVSSTTRPGTASRAAQQQPQQPQQGSVPPGTASRRLTTAQKRPTTAVRAAGFVTGGGGAFGSVMVPSGPSQFEKKEER